MLPSTSDGKLINIHCLFNPEYEVHLENDFFSSIHNQEGYKMNRADITSYGRKLFPQVSDNNQLYKLGIDNFAIAPGDLISLFNQKKTLRENTLVVVSNSNKDGASGTQKHYDLFEGEPGALDGVRNSIYYLSDAIFSANAKDIKYFLGRALDDKPNVTEKEKQKEKEKVIHERGSLKSCLVGCDAHNEEALFSRFTWVKGNLNFRGLKQIIYEPEQRVKIQDHEPDLKEDKLVIEEVRFISSNNVFTPNSIRFNRNLNVIIGGKSSGKSILLFAIAKTLLADRSILKTQDKGKYRYDFPSDFDFEVKIASKHVQSINRTDDQPSILSEIKYIPQNYLSKLAEPENKKGNDLVKLVRGLLLEDPESELRYRDFENILNSNDIERENIINSYFDIKDQIAVLKNDLIQRGDVSVLQTNVNTNEAKIKELNTKAGLTPEQILEYGQLSGELELIELEINKIRSDYSKVVNFNSNSKSSLEGILQKRNQLFDSLENSKIIDKLNEVYSQIDLALLSLTTLIDDISLNEDRQFINQNIFKEEFQVRAKRSVVLKESLKPYLQNDIIKKEINDLEVLVTADKQKINSINQITNEIEKNIIALESEKVRLFDAIRKNHEEYNNIILALKERADLLQNDNLKIMGSPKYNFSKMRERIYQRADGRKLNSDRFKILDLKRSNLEDVNIDELVNELKEVFTSMVEKEDFPFLSKADLKEAIKTLLYDYFFDHWDVIYDKDRLNEMSTGKASFVILMLIVGLSKAKSPILIDQPEDNLDNRSITKNLVEYLKNKKLERQIILVTHNANVVVNSDAENIIVANQEGQNDRLTSSIYKFDYINGALENSKKLNESETDLLKSMGIKEHIADIVEGGEEAFKKRERKYGFKAHIGKV